MSGPGGSDIDYGFIPPTSFRPNDPWDVMQTWDGRQAGATGPTSSDIEYGWGTQGIVNDDQAKQEQQQQQQQQEEPEMMIRYYVPPKVEHPAPRSHKGVPSGTDLMKQVSHAEEAAEKSALQELIANPRWQVVRAGEALRVLRLKGSEGLESDPYSFTPLMQGVLVVVEPKNLASAQRYVKGLRSRGVRLTCVCLVEKSPSCKDPVAVSTFSSALLACGADEVLMEGWLGYYVNGRSIGGYKASLTGSGMVPNPVAGDVSYQAAQPGYGGADFFGRTGMVSIA